MQSSRALRRARIAARPDANALRRAAIDGHGARIGGMWLYEAAIALDEAAIALHQRQEAHLATLEAEIPTRSVRNEPEP